MNKTIRAITAVIGVLFAISGMNHGIFEVMQGNTPTSGYFIQSIGEDMQMWEYGTQDALTIMPTFLSAGIATVIVSVAIMIWSIWFLDTHHGASIFLLLFIALFLVGGGVAQVIFFLLAWSFATRINQSLSWWQALLSKPVRKSLSKIWRWALLFGTIVILLGLAIATFGYLPSIDDADLLLSILGMLILSGFGLFLLSFIAGIANDIEQREQRHTI